MLSDTQKDQIIALYKFYFKGYCNPLSESTKKYYLGKLYALDDVCDILDLKLNIDFTQD